MNDDKQRSRLGRGLAALIGEVQTASDTIERTRGQRKVPIEFVATNPNNPRRNFNTSDLDDLTQSVRAKGIVQPILVRPTSGPQEPYEIVAGERRWRAAQKAGLAEVPVIIVEMTDREALEVAIVENVQRTDLNAVEEAAGYQRLMDEFGYTQNDLGEMIGKSRSHVANTLRLLRLPESVKTLIESGELTAGHARTLITAEDPEALAKRIVEGDMSVRAAEILAREPEADNSVIMAKEAARKPRKEKPEPVLKLVGDDEETTDPDTRMLENQLTEALGLAVKISDRNGSGEIRISYSSLEQLDYVCTLLRG